jgi:hypothetical protein
MNEWIVFNLLIVGFAVLSPIVLIFLFFVSAPYGRHIRDNWGPEINNKWGWFLMEVPTILLFLFFYLIGDTTYLIVPSFFLLIWMIHYIHRTLIFPFLIRGKNNMPIIIMIFGMVFNIINTYLQARWINTFSNNYSLNWLLTLNFQLGIIIFVIGFVINIHSDYKIRNLRDPGEDEYKIPRGGLFQWVSSPNYLGEIIEWSGWAIMTCSLPGLIFAIWTFANLAPRAYANHLWYLEKFSEYPDKRKALIPYIF